MEPERDLAHMTGDARKRWAEQRLAEEGPVDVRAVTKKLADDVDAYLTANFDEQHAHLHEWPDYDDH